MCSQVHAWLAEIAKRPGSVVWKGCLCIYVMCGYVVGSFGLFICECFWFQLALRHGHFVWRSEWVICIARTSLIKTNTLKSPRVCPETTLYFVGSVSVWHSSCAFSHTQQITTSPVGCFVENILLSLFSKTHLHLICPIIHLRLVI